MTYSRIYGLDVVLSEDRPRYVMPDELLPGVPWPAGFRDSMNRWAADFLGTINPIPDSEVLVMGSFILMNTRTYMNFRQRHDAVKFPGARA